MSGQESDSSKNKVLVGLPFDTPVVDIEINPYVNVAPKKSSISVPQHTFTYSWFVFFPGIFLVYFDLEG